MSCKLLSLFVTYSRPQGRGIVCLCNMSYWAAGLRACALERTARAAGFRLNSRRRWLSRWRAGTCGTGSLLHAGILWDTVRCPGPPSVELRVCIVRASRLCGGIPDPVGHGSNCVNPYSPYPLKIASPTRRLPTHYDVRAPAVFAYDRRGHYLG